MNFEIPINDSSQFDSGNSIVIGEGNEITFGNAIAMIPDFCRAIALPGCYDSHISRKQDHPVLETVGHHG